MDDIISKRKNLQIYFSSPTKFIQELGAPILRKVFMKGFLSILRSEESFENFVKNFQVFDITHIDKNRVTIFFKDGSSEGAKLIPIVNSDFIADDERTIYAGLSVTKYVPTVQYGKAKVIALIYMKNTDIEEHLKSYEKDVPNERSINVEFDDDSLKDAISTIYGLFYQVQDDLEEIVDDKVIEDIEVIEKNLKKWQISREKNGTTIIKNPEGKESKKGEEIKKRN